MQKLISFMKGLAKSLGLIWVVTAFFTLLAFVGGRDSIGFCLFISLFLMPVFMIAALEIATMKTARETGLSRMQIFKELSEYIRRM